MKRSTLSTVGVWKAHASPVPKGTIVQPQRCYDKKRRAQNRIENCKYKKKEKKKKKNRAYLGHADVRQHTCHSISTPNRLYDNATCRVLGAGV